METRVKDHASARNRLNTYLIGELSVTDRDLSPAVVEVQQRTGIQPPVWFNTAGVKFTDVNAIAVAQRAGR